MIQFQDSIIEGRELILDSRTEVYYFGHDLTLKNCRLVIQVPARALVFARTRLIDCTLEIKRTLKGFRWWSASLEGCRFKGRLESCDFGSWSDVGHYGHIQGCDFSEARLDWCRFNRCDASTLRFPSWPCFTLLNPVQRLDELKRISWPGETGWIVSTLAKSSPQTAAITIHAEDFARESETTAEALKAALQGLGGVIY